MRAPSAPSSLRDFTLDTGRPTNRRRYGDVRWVRPRRRRLSAPPPAGRPPPSVRPSRARALDSPRACAGLDAVLCGGVARPRAATYEGGRKTSFILEEFPSDNIFHQPPVKALDLAGISIVTTAQKLNMSSDGQFPQHRPRGGGTRCRAACYFSVSSLCPLLPLRSPSWTSFAIPSDAFLMRVMTDATDVGSFSSGFK